MSAEIVQHTSESGLTPSAYLEVAEQRAAIDPAGLEGTEAERAEFAKLNLHRVGRIRRTWRPSEELASLVARIDHPLVRADARFLLHARGPAHLGQVLRRVPRRGEAH